jgi:hypothetical protein
VEFVLYVSNCSLEPLPNDGLPKYSERSASNASKKSGHDEECELGKIKSQALANRQLTY